MPPVSSSNVAAVDYDEERRVLVVQYNSGGVYEYFPDVPREVYEGVLNAESVGKAMNELVKPNYQYLMVN